MDIASLKEDNLLYIGFSTHAVRFLFFNVKLPFNGTISQQLNFIYTMNNLGNSDTVLVLSKKKKKDSAGKTSASTA